MDQTIQALQDQVQRLYADIGTLRGSHDSSSSPYPDPSSYPHQPSLVQAQSGTPYHTTGPPAAPSRVRHRRFQGPTSSAFNINVANSSLQTMGLTDPSLTETEGHDYDDLPSTSPQQRQTSNPMASSQYAKDPIWTIGKDEAIRLCRVYDEEIGMMYPMLDIEQTIEKADKLFTFTEATTKPGMIDQSNPSTDAMHNPDINILKMVLATVLILEGGGQSELGSVLFDTVRGTCESKLGEPPDIGGLRLLVIMVHYAVEMDFPTFTNQSHRLSFDSSKVQRSKLIEPLVLQLA